MAERFRGMWLPAGIGAGAVVDLLRRYVAEVRGFNDPDDVATIVGETICIIAEREAAALIAFRRPPRRRRPRIIRGEQFALRLEDAA